VDVIESEGFRNQALTAAAAARQASAPREGRKRALVLQLDEREQLALDLMGGAKAWHPLTSASAVVPPRPIPLRIWRHSVSIAPIASL
jgi:hypothetical protein